MGKIADKAKKIDLYASRPVLSFGKDGKVYSRLGLLLTLLTVVIIGGMAIWIGIRVFGRQTPSFIRYDLPPKVNNPRIEFNTDNFKFSITMGGGIDEDNRLVRYDPLMIDSYASTYEEMLIPVTVTDCVFEQTSGSWQKCFSQPDETKDRTFLDTVGFGTFVINLGFCHNTEIFYDCYSEQEARETMRNASMSSFFYYEDVLIDPFNYENPMEKTVKMYSDLIMLDVPRAVTVELNEIEFISDNGWLFEDLKTETKLKASISSRVGNRDFYTYEFKYGGTKTVYKRTYPKIQDFLAQLSGLITIITPIFIILVSPYGNLQAIQHLVNEIYEIKLNKSDSPQKPSSSSKKKRRSSKSKSLATSPKGTEGDLLPQQSKVKAKVKPKTQASLPPPNRKSVPFAPHAALVIGGVGKLPTREETPPIPEENTTPLRFETFEKSPSSPFKLNSLTSRHDDESNLITPQKSLLAHAKTSSSEEQKPEEDGKLNKNLEIGNQSPVEESESEIESEEEESEEIPLRTSDPLEVPLLGWLKSFWKPSPEVQVLTKAKEHILETFDLVTLSKKVIEIDKLKACLLTHDQRVIFENLPSSVIVLNPGIDLKSPEAIRQYHWKDSFKGDETALRKAYSRLKETQNQLDQLLIKLYESEYINDGFRQEDEP